mgnify:CR=1 FL=1
MKTLTPRQEQFVENYVLCDNATEAARRAGYGERGAGVTATRLLKNANVLAAIDVLRAANAERFALSREAVIEEILAAIAVAKEQSNPLVVISGWREIAKMCGFYQPVKHQVEIPRTQSDMLRRFEAMSDEELIAIVASDCSECTVV